MDKLIAELRSLSRAGGWPSESLAQAADALELQAREIAGLQKLLDRAHMRMDELKAQPSGVLPYPSENHDCNYESGDGKCSECDALSRHSAVRKLIEQAVVAHCAGGDLWLTTELAAREVARLNQPASAGDERGHDTKGSRKALGAMNARLRAKVGRLERELAALSANHSEQVRHMVTDSCLTCNGVGIVGHSIICPECTAPSADVPCAIKCCGAGLPSECIYGNCAAQQQER